VWRIGLDACRRFFRSRKVMGGIILGFESLERGPRASIFFKKRSRFFEEPALFQKRETRVTMLYIRLIIISQSCRAGAVRQEPENRKTCGSAEAFVRRGERLIPPQISVAPYAHFGGTSRSDVRALNPPRGREEAFKCALSISQSPCLWLPNANP
jgi:hypothetical protein